MRPTHLPSFSGLSTNTRGRPADAVELSDYTACEAADSGHGSVIFLMRLTGADEAACVRVIERAESLGLVYTLGEGTALMDEAGKRYLQDRRLTVAPEIRQRVAETVALMNKERRQREEERKLAFRESRRWERFMDEDPTHP